MLLTRQDWFGTLFLRLPVNVQKVIDRTSGDRRGVASYIQFVEFEMVCFWNGFVE